MNLKEAFNTNRETWNKKVAVHASSDFYSMTAFKKGASSLKSYELKALGDVKGKTLMHLQCHFGQDTLSWSRLGATCTGVDISEEGIKLAKDLAAELSLDANFLCCNVLDVSDYISEKFDIIFTSYGTIGWLPDLKPWGQMIADRLKDGGFFYIVDFHPIAWMFDYRDNPPQMKYGYLQKEVIYEEYRGTYANTESNMISKEYSWNHSIGEIINSLVKAGLTIEYFNEMSASPYDIFPDLIKNDEGLFELQSNLYPLVFEIKATKLVPNTLL